MRRITSGRTTRTTASRPAGATGRSKRSGFFRRLELAITRVTGARPRHDDGGTRSGIGRAAHERPGAHLSLETTEPTPFGSGFISGLLSAILGIAGFGAVLCLRFPEYLTHATLRPFYSLGYLRAIIHVTLVASFLLGSVSAFLRANKTLALTGIGFTLAAALLGGSQVPVDGDVRGAARGSASISSS